MYIYTTLPHIHPFIRCQPWTTTASSWGAVGVRVFCSGTPLSLIFLIHLLNNLITKVCSVQLQAISILLTILYKHVIMLQFMVSSGRYIALVKSFVFAQVRKVISPCCLSIQKYLGCKCLKCHCCSTDPHMNQNSQTDTIQSNAENGSIPDVLKMTKKMQALIHT